MNYLICPRFDCDVFLLKELNFIRSCGFLWLAEGPSCRHVFYDATLVRVFIFQEDIYAECEGDKYWVWRDNDFIKVRGRAIVAELRSIGRAGKQVGDYTYRRYSDDFPVIRHEFFDGKNRVSGRLESHTLISTFSEYFLFYNFKDNILFEYDFDFNVRRNYGFDGGKDVLHDPACSNYVVVLINNSAEQSSVLIFNIINFSIVSSLDFDCRIQRISQLQSSYDDLFFRADNNLIKFSSSTGKLLKLLDGKAITETSIKEHFMYASFLGSSSIAICNLQGELKSDSIEGISGYEVKELYSEDECNCVVDGLINSNMLAGLGYFSFWKDSDITGSLSPNIEEPTFKISKIQNSKGFSIKILIENKESYSVAARHALAALDQSIYDHGEFLGRAHSPDFTGLVEWQFKNGALLSPEQRAQLRAAGTYLLEDKYSMFKGAATGDDCSLSISFD